MRGSFAIIVATLGLSACGGDDRPIVVIPQAAAPASAPVIVPQGTATPQGSYATVGMPEGVTVICPGGKLATFSDRAYHC